MILEHYLTGTVRPPVGRLEHEENLMSDLNGPSEPFHGRGSETEVLDLFGVHIRILMPASATDGALSIFDDHNNPGAGPPLHVHHDADEIFFVVAGSYQFICSEKVIEAGAGNIVLVPRGAPHTFLNCGTGPGHLLVTLRPGGFEEFFRTVVDAKLEVPRDMPAIAGIGPRAGADSMDGHAVRFAAHARVRADCHLASVTPTSCGTSWTYTSACKPIAGEASLRRQLRADFVAEVGGIGAFRLS